ncbi:hypothetical protein LDENG_00276280, partial [Lucifuga dentata]
MEVWKVGKTFLIHRSSSILWKMIVSNVTCMKTEYIRLKHAKWTVWSFKHANYRKHSWRILLSIYKPKFLHTHTHTRIKR